MLYFSISSSNHSACILWMTHTGWRLNNRINLFGGCIWKSLHFYSRNHKRIVIFCNYSTEINTVWEWLNILINIIIYSYYCGNTNSIFSCIQNTARQNRGCLETSSERRAARNWPDRPGQLTGQGQLPPQPTTRATLGSPWWQNSHQGQQIQAQRNWNSEERNNQCVSSCVLSQEIFSTFFFNVFSCCFYLLSLLITS